MEALPHRPYPRCCLQYSVHFQPKGMSVIRAPDSHCLSCFSCSRSYADSRASRLVDPTYVYPLVMIVIPYPILTENRRQRPVNCFALKFTCADLSLVSALDATGARSTGRMHACFCQRRCNTLSRISRLYALNMTV